MFGVGQNRLKINSKEVVSPVFLNPAELIIDSRNEKFSIIPVSAQKVLNPFLITHFKISIEEEKLIADFDSLGENTKYATKTIMKCQKKKKKH